MAGSAVDLAARGRVLPAVCMARLTTSPVRTPQAGGRRGSLAHISGLGPRADGASPVDHDAQARPDVRFGGPQVCPGSPPGRPKLLQPIHHHSFDAISFWHRRRPTGLGRLRRTPPGPGLRPGGAPPIGPQMRTRSDPMAEQWRRGPRVRRAAPPSPRGLGHTLGESLSS